MHWLAIGVLLWLATAGLYIASNPRAQTILFIASGRSGLGLPITEVGSVNFTTPQLNQDPRIVRWVYVKLPSEMLKGRSIEMVISFSPDKRKVREEDEAEIPLDFNADEEEPEVDVQILAPNFAVDPPSKSVRVKLYKDREVTALFRMTPSPDAAAGKTEIDIIALYKGLTVGRFTRNVKIKDHSVDHLSVRQVTTILLILGIIGAFFAGLQIFLKG